MNQLNTLAGLREATTLMLAGLDAHQDRLAPRGLGEPFQTDFQMNYDQFFTVFNEQQALKARWMEKISQRLQIQQRLVEKYREARKIVKIALPEETWREFGITDQR